VNTGLLPVHVRLPRAALWASSQAGLTPQRPAASALVVDLGARPAFEPTLTTTVRLLHDTGISPACILYEHLDASISEASAALSMGFIYETFALLNSKGERIAFADLSVFNFLEYATPLYFEHVVSVLGADPASVPHDETARALGLTTMAHTAGYLYHGVIS
jgi:hypothetical protein